VIEADVVKAFAAWLSGEGWLVRIDVEHVDVVAQRDGVTLLAGAKGYTSSPGLGYRSSQAVGPPGLPLDRKTVRLPSQ
jgi:hypothetical protein